MSKTPASRITNSEARDWIARRREFKNSTGSLRGARIEPGWVPDTLGELPYSAATVGGVNSAEYVVYSYQTPIAWWTSRNGWVRPPVKYSRTTSRHQGLCPADDNPSRWTV